MKTINAKIENDVVLINPETPTDIELKELPAYKNWDKLRSLGWIACHLVGEPKTGGLNWHYPEDDLDRLELEIATYDWYYEMSDDPRVYNEGRSKDNRINALAQKVGKEKYNELWKVYVEARSNGYSDSSEFVSTFLRRVIP